MRQVLVTALKYLVTSFMANILKTLQEEEAGENDLHSLTLLADLGSDSRSMTGPGSLSWNCGGLGVLSPRNLSLGRN